MDGGKQRVTVCMEVLSVVQQNRYAANEQTETVPPTAFSFSLDLSPVLALIRTSVAPTDHDIRVKG